MAGGREVFANLALFALGHLLVTIIKAHLRLSRRYLPTLDLALRPDHSPWWILEVHRPRVQTHCLLPQFNVILIRMHLSIPKSHPPFIYRLRLLIHPP
jgi:hypothetical protein